MSIWAKVSRPPVEVLKEIKGGRLKGMAQIKQLEAEGEYIEDGKFLYDCPSCGNDMVFKKAENTFKEELTKYLADNEKVIGMFNDFKKITFFLCDDQEAPGELAELIYSGEISVDLKKLYTIEQRTVEEAILYGLSSLYDFVNYYPEDKTIKPTEKVNSENGASSSCEIELEVIDISKVIVEYDEGVPLPPKIRRSNIVGQLLFGDGTKENLNNMFIEDIFIENDSKLYTDLQTSVLKELGYLD